MVTVASFRDYLNPPPDISDTQLELWLKSAKSEARTAGVPEYQNNAQYDLFIYALGAWYYDNRGMQVSGTYQATALETMQRIKNAYVLQLRYAGEDPEPVPESSPVPDPEPEPEPESEPDPEPGEPESGGGDGE